MVTALNNKNYSFLLILDEVYIADDKLYHKIFISSLNFVILFLCFFFLRK